MGNHVRRREPKAAGGAGLPVLKDEAFAKLYPATWENLTELTYPDGAARQTLTVLVFHEGHQWKACVRDRDAGLVAFVTAGTMVGLWLAIEVGLSTDKLDWRADSWTRGKVRK